MTRAGPRTAPPWLPRDLDRVSVATIPSPPASRAAASAPRPPSPSTPRPWASSTSRAAFAERQTSASAGSGAASPSTEKTESVTARARPSCARRAFSNASGSAWGTTAVSARESLAAVHDRGVVARVGGDEGAAPGECGQRGEIGRVPGGEHEGRLETAERGELPFQPGVQGGGPGDQPGPRRPRPPAVGGVGRGGDDLRVPGEAQVVVAREVQQLRLGAARTQGAYESGGGPAAGLGVDPVERGEGHGAVPWVGGPSAGGSARTLRRGRSLCRQPTDPSRVRSRSGCGNTHTLARVSCLVPPWLEVVP